MVSLLLKLFAAVLMALSGTGVSAQTHHVVGDDSWLSLSGRVFRVGDKIWFKYSGKEDSIVELQDLEDFLSCNFTNPIKMYTDPVTHVSLEREGVRYFASGNVESCKNGLKLPVPVEFDPPEPTPEYWPPQPFEPTPEYGPPEPLEPPPVLVPPPPRAPSAATHLNDLSIVFAAGLFSFYIFY